MIKGVRIGGNGPAMSYLDTLRVPIIPNTPFEEDLTESMAAAMDKYPEAAAILVRRHGIYVWGTLRSCASFFAWLLMSIFQGMTGKRQRRKPRQGYCAIAIKVAEFTLRSVPGLSVRDRCQDEACRYPDGSEQLMRLYGYLRLRCKMDLK